MFKGKLKIVMIGLLWLSMIVQAETYYHKDHLFNMGMGMRPLALGKAFTAVDADVNAMMFNPAGLSSIEKPVIMGLKARRLADVDQYAFLSAYALPEDRGVVALGYLELTLPDILIADEFFDADGYTQVVGKAKYGERAYILSYAKRLEQHALGINVKAYSVAFTTDVSDITDDVHGNANDIDIGYLYYLNPEWKLGLSYRDAIGKMRWSTETYEKMRSVTKLGAAYAFSHKEHHGQLLFDYEFAADTPGLARIGIEDTMWDIFTLRLGCLQRVWASTTKFSVVGGVGINYKGFTLDYAYFPDVAEETDNKHFVSIGYMFGAESKPEIKEKQVYAPTIEVYSDSIEAVDEPARAPTRRFVDRKYTVMESAY